MYVRDMPPLSLSPCTASYIKKPYQNPVYKCTGSRQGFMQWAIAYVKF